MGQTSSETPATKSDETPRLLPIPIDSLDFRVHDLDMYIAHRDQKAPALYRAAGTEFTKEDADRLISQSVKFVHIPVSQHAVYRKALSERLDRQFSDPDASKQERSRVVRAACTKMIEDVLLFPGQAEPIAAISELAQQFSGWAESDPDTFSYMLNMSDHDFYTTTHMVNVGVGCGLLAAQLRPGEKEFIDRLYQGGLLHDLGKRDVPPEVLNKEGKLSDEEWGLIRQHPKIGFEELEKCEGVPIEVLEMTRDHHERLDGTGYPSGRTAESLSLATRICSVVDVFDALTAARPYRGPMPPANALKIMQDGVGTQFDEEIFETWKALVEGLLHVDPTRAAPMAPPEKFGTLDTLAPPAPQPPGAGSLDDTSTDDRPVVGGDGNRRMFERFTLALPVEAEFARQLKRYPVAIGQRFKVRTVDISRGGIQIETPWPLAINDLLIVHLSTREGVVRWLTRVARVRSADRSWRAGLQLLRKVASSEAA